MKYRWVILPAVVMCLLLIGQLWPAFVCFAHNEGSHGSSKFTKHFEKTFFAITEKGSFSIEILPDEQEYKIGQNVVGIVVHSNHDEDVEGAMLTVTAEGNNERIVVREKGAGLYTASNLNLNRGGAWKLIIQIKKKAIEDRAIFTFPRTVSKYLPPGAYSRSDLP